MFGQKHVHTEYTGARYTWENMALTFFAEEERGLQEGEICSLEENEEGYAEMSRQAHSVTYPGHAL